MINIEGCLTKNDGNQRQNLYDAWEDFAYKGDQAPLQKWFEERIRVPLLERIATQTHANDM